MDKLKLEIPSLVEWKTNLDKEIIEILYAAYKSSSKVIFDDEARIIYLFSQLFSDKKNEKSKLEIHNPPNRAKNNDIANIYLHQAIIHENKKEFDMANDLYTRAIAHTELKTPLLGVLYFKRSNIYYCHGLFRDCLADFEQASNFLTLEKLQDEITFRIIDCHLGLAEVYLLCSLSYVQHAPPEVYDTLSEKLRKNATFIINTVEMYKWDFRPMIKTKHDTLPDFTDALEVKYTEELGKHVIATRDIEPGEILCVEKAYAITVNRGLRYNICSYCKVQTWSSITCDECVEVVYCSIRCREYAYREYHKIECKVIPKLLSYGINNKFLMALRITIVAMKEINNSIDAMKHKLLVMDKFIPLPIFNKLFVDALSELKYDSIYMTASKYSPHLMTHESQSVASCIIMAYFYGMEIKLFEKKDRMNLLTLANDKNFLFLVQFMEINTRIANFNGLTMSMPVAGQRSIKVSTALNGYSNLFPHSCRKMIVHSLHYNRIGIRSVCSIKKGEQVFDNYGIAFDHYDKEKRQELLKNFNYICKCEACVNDVQIEPTQKDESDLEVLRGEIETLQERVKNLDSYTSRRYIINDHLPLPNYIPESKIVPEIIQGIEVDSKYNTKELNKCIDLFLDVVAVEQVPYVTLQDLELTVSKYFL